MRAEKRMEPSKVILLGNPGVGKTSMFLRLWDGSFHDEHWSDPASLDKLPKSFRLDSGEIETLEIWDTAGLERFRSVTRSYFIGAKAVVLVYDLTVSKSFYDLLIWLQDTKSFAPDAAVFLIGNKTDLGVEDTERKVVEVFVETNDVKLHFRVSAKKNEGLHEAFTAIAQYVYTDRISDHSASVSGRLHRTPPTLSWGASCSC